MRIATWNVNSLRVRLPQVLDWLGKHRPDALCLQELKLEDASFPKAELLAAGYSAAFSGQKTYNGVAILSRAPASNIVCGIAGFDDPQRRVISADIGDVRLVCAYVPNGQSIDSEKYQYKLKWLLAFATWLEGELAAHARLAVLGDYNIAPEDRDVHDPKAWEGQVLVSPPERDAYRRLIELGLHLVGLPHERLQAQPGPAHRPHPARPQPRGELCQLLDRPGTAPKRTSFRPRTGRCRNRSLNSNASGAKFSLRQSLRVAALLL
jgi:exodeoxyribonuclease-3